MAAFSTPELFSFAHVAASHVIKDKGSGVENGDCSGMNGKLSYVKCLSGLACSRLSVSGGLKKRAATSGVWLLIPLVTRSRFRPSSLTESLEQAILARLKLTCPRNAFLAKKSRGGHRVKCVSNHLSALVTSCWIPYMFGDQSLQKG